MRPFYVLCPSQLDHGDISSRNIQTFINFGNSLLKYKSSDLLFYYPQEGVTLPFSHFHHDLKLKNQLQEFENILVENDIDLSVIYGSVYNPKQVTNIKNLDIMAWPTFLLHNSCYDMQDVYKKPIKDIVKQPVFDKLFMCLNNQPRSHRCAVVDDLYRLGLFENNLISWNTLTNENYCLYDFKYWKEELLILDKLDDDVDKDYRSYTDLFLDNKCFLNVVNETYCDNNVPFITEKTYKNLLIGQPFICFGTKFQNTCLRDYGFELYDELFDYSYDSMENFENKVVSFTENINRIKNENPYHLYEKIKDKVIYNRNRVYDIINNDPYIPQKVVNMYVKNAKVFKDNYEMHHFIGEIMKNKL